MAWDIVALFGGTEPGRAKVAKGAGTTLKRQVNIYLKNIEWERVDPEAPGDEDCLLIFRIELSRFQESLNNSMSEFADAVFTSLALRMIQRGFIPLDGEGDSVYILKEYGFMTLYASGERGRQKELEELAARAADEVPDWIKFSVNLLASDEKMGDLFQANFALNDCRPAIDRRRLILALFFRMTILAAGRGFISVPPPENDEDGEE